MLMVVVIGGCFVKELMGSSCFFLRYFMMLKTVWT